MNSGDFLKKPMTTQDDFVYHLQEVEQAVIREDWTKDEMKSINVSLSRLNAFLRARDSSQALAAAAEIREHWEHLNE